MRNSHLTTNAFESRLRGKVTVENKLLISWSHRTDLVEICGVLGLVLVMLLSSMKVFLNQIHIPNFKILVIDPNLTLYWDTETNLMCPAHQQVDTDM